MGGQPAARRRMRRRRSCTCARYRSAGAPLGIRLTVHPDAGHCNTKMGGRCNTPPQFGQSRASAHAGLVAPALCTGMMRASVHAHRLPLEPSVEGQQRTEVALGRQTQRPFPTAGVHVPKDAAAACEGGMQA